MHVPEKAAHQDFTDILKAKSYAWLPTSIYRFGANIYHKIHDCRFRLKSMLVASRFLITPNGLPDLLIDFGRTPGDDLLCTAVLRELRRRNNLKVAMIAVHPELFTGNHDASHVVAPAQGLQIFAHRWRRQYRWLEYSHYDGDDRSEVPQRHIIAGLCATAGIKGRVALRPYITLMEHELNEAAWARGLIVIQSTGMGARYPMLNKQWYPERFQAVVSDLRHNFDFIQLGSKNDPKLEHVHDFRGTTSIRQSAAILHYARLYVGNVGFLMHLARSVDCPSVIVYGGREAPWQSGYICNINLYSPVPCAPCWQWNRCDFDRRCMKEITVDHVIGAVRDLICRPRNSLAVETVDI